MSEPTDVLRDFTKSLMKNRFHLLVPQAGRPRIAHGFIAGIGRSRDEVRGADDRKHSGNFAVIISNRPLHGLAESFSCLSQQ